ncbi:MAG: sulfatase-like hydrolase/transferase [Acidobacteria bacterium]|nr:sulfatase-like hydrolase/transferase [Acidobacteriota bacterium]
MRSRLAARASVVLALTAAACGGASTPPPAASPTPRHLVLVTIDTLRADRLGVYGATTVPTPHLDRIAREGVHAAEANAHSPITRPAHASLLTGLYPPEHGLRDNISRPLASTVPTLAEVLAGKGFTTAAFVSSFVLAKQSGLDRGFAHYDDVFDAGSGDAVLFVNSVQRRGDQTLEKVEQWLDARPADQRTTPTALWVHLYDPHDPYEPPEPYATRFADRPYDGEVAWTDELIGRLRAMLEVHGLWQDALVVITADHGEALGEHGETGHGYFAYETTLRVPLIARGPGLPAATTIPGVVRAVDVMPTVLALLGAGAAAPPTTGVSLAAAFRGGTPPSAPTYAESLTPLIHYQWSDLRVLRDGRWKYILAPRPELYDLAADPGETTNRAAAEPARARALRAALEGVLRAERDRSAAEAPGTAAAALSADTLQKLGALGYVSPGAAAGSVAQGADPKDKIEEFSTLNGLMRDGLTLLGAGRFAESAAKLTALRTAGGDSFQVHFYLGRALVGLGRTREAEAAFERTVELMPTYGQAYLALADARHARQDTSGALAALAKGQAALPKDAALVDREGQLRQQLGQRDRALAAYRRVMTLAPKDALVRWRAGELLLDLGQPDQAQAMFREATTLDGSVPDFWNSLGMVLGGGGRHDDAAAAFREAIRLDAKNARYAYNLGLVLQRAGRPDAAEWFQRTLALEPSFRPARERLAELGR